MRTVSCKPLSFSSSDSGVSGAYHEAAGSAAKMQASPLPAEEALKQADNGGSVNLAPASESQGPDAAQYDKMPGQGMDPIQSVDMESQVVQPQDQKIMDGEGNITPVSEVSSLEGGDTPGAADGGDAGGGAVAMDYQPAGPGTTFMPTSSSPSQDPLAVQVDAVQPGFPETQLRSPTGISGEIGGRVTDEEGSVI